MTAEVPSRVPFSRAHRRWKGLALLLSMLVPLACVNLSKPGNVEECAKTSTCLDESGKSPVPEPGPDAAASPDGPLTPDLASPDAAPDVPSDPGPVDPDGPGAPDLSPDVPLAPDARNDSRNSDVVINDGSRDPITAIDRALGPETPTELGPEPRPEPGPELGPEPGPETGPELGSESGREQGPELGPEPGPESGQEQGPEPAPEPAPEPGRDGGDSGPVSCIAQLIADGYAAGKAAPCSKCIDNLTPLVTKCMDMINCLAPPSTQADFLACLHSVSGSGVVGDCVSALTTAACPGGY